MRVISWLLVVHLLAIEAVFLLSTFDTVDYLSIASVHQLV